MGSVAVLMVLGFFTCTAGYRVQTSSSRESLNVGLLLPHTNFGVREYTRAINNAVSGLHRSQKQRRIEWLKKYSFSPLNVHTDMMKLTPSPTGLFVFSNCLSSECLVCVKRKRNASVCVVGDTAVVVDVLLLYRASHMCSEALQQKHYLLNHVICLITEEQNLNVSKPYSFNDVYYFMIHI